MSGIVTVPAGAAALLTVVGATALAAPVVAAPVVAAGALVAGAVVAAAAVVGAALAAGALVGAVVAGAVVLDDEPQASRSAPTTPAAPIVAAARRSVRRLSRAPFAEDPVADVASHDEPAMSSSLAVRVCADEQNVH
jgi:hypothetical protein